jgi:cyclopropane fatty-acyl-phospholipid synthase-like methyltransferase
MTDARRMAPATQRNREPITEVLRGIFTPATRHVLEIASGTGEHITHFAAAFPDIVFHPSDLDAEARASIAAWTRDLGLANVRPPIALDVQSPPETLPPVDAILCINMIHIAPWPATIGLLKLAADLLPGNGALVLYGPYKRDGVHTSNSNAAFDETLRSRNPYWGIRNLEDVIAAAIAVRLTDPAITQMPANNLSLEFRRLPKSRV